MYASIPVALPVRMSAQPSIAYIKEKMNELADDTSLCVNPITPSEVI